VKGQQYRALSMLQKMDRIPRRGTSGKKIFPVWMDRMRNGEGGNRKEKRKNKEGRTATQKKKNWVEDSAAGGGSVTGKVTGKRVERGEEKAGGEKGTKKTPR